jgi:hypothetical protein
MLSSICSWAAIAAGIMSAIEWWRASKVPMTDNHPQNAQPDPSMPPAPYNPKQTSIGSLREAGETSGALNNRAALWAAAGVILAAASTLLAAKCP